MLMVCAIHYTIVYGKSYPMAYAIYYPIVYAMGISTTLGITVGQFAIGHCTFMLPLLS